MSEPPLHPERCFDELLALYVDLAREIEGLDVACRQCGECCNFVRNDYRLYASFPERALVVARHGEPRLTADGDCRFLRDGHCSIHPDRPLGCRTYFCDPAHADREQNLYHQYQRRLHSIADTHRLPWNYQPFFST